MFYELGVRHALSNRTIMIAQRLSDIPSDLQGYACLEYDCQTDAGQLSLTTRLCAVIGDLETATERSDNPVSDFLRARSAVILDFERSQNIRKLIALNLELLVIASLLTNENVEADAHGMFWYPTIACPALDHYLATQYVLQDAFSNDALRLRALLAAMGGNRLAYRTFENSKTAVETVRRNLIKIITAYKASNALTALDLEPVVFSDPTTDKASEGAPRSDLSEESSRSDGDDQPRHP